MGKAASYIECEMRGETVITISRVISGGGWIYPVQLWVRAAVRDWSEPQERVREGGVRCVIRL